MKQNWSTSWRVFIQTNLFLQHIVTGIVNKDLYVNLRYDIIYPRHNVRFTRDILMDANKHTKQQFADVNNWKDIVNIPHKYYISPSKISSTIFLHFLFDTSLVSLFNFYYLIFCLYYCLSTYVLVI